MFHRQLALKTKTYYYHFDHLGSISLADILIDKLFIFKKIIGYHTTLALGVCHGDELFYLFKYVVHFFNTIVPNIKNGSKLSHDHQLIWYRSTQLALLSEDNIRDQKMVDFMVEKWTNFAIYHNPTPQDNTWPPYGSNGITYVRLNDSKIIVQNDKVRDDRLRFWTQIRNRIDWIYLFNYTDQIFTVSFEYYSVSRVNS